MGTFQDEMKNMKKIFLTHLTLFCNLVYIWFNLKKKHCFKMVCISTTTFLQKCLPSPKVAACNSITTEFGTPIKEYFCVRSYEDHPQRLSIKASQNSLNFQHFNRVFFPKILNYCKNCFCLLHILCHLYMCLCYHMILFKGKCFVKL